MGLLRRQIGGFVVACLAAQGFVQPAVGAEKAFPFKPGDILSAADAERLRAWLPPQFWAHRRYFVWDGMEMEIGPAHRDYSPPEVYRQATERHRGRARLGEDGTLVDYHSGQPFPVDAIDCAGDPQAGTKLIWNFVHRWQGFGAQASYRYTYLDRGEVLDLQYAGTTSAWILKHRPEPQFEATGGDVFPDELRYAVVGFELDEPPEAAGLRTLTYRYEASFAPLAVAKPEKTWIYIRQTRRIRQISQTRRSSAVAGTDFTFDDLFSFAGLPAQYHWKCLGEAEVLAPTNTKRLGYPYEKDRSFGPSGLSYASDRWELRRAIRIEMVPKDPDHPYSRKELWIDRQTMQPLYSFAYDRKGELWKIIYHNHRWSEDDLQHVKARDWYAGWDNVPEPRDLRVSSDAILNVQTGTGNRLDFWDSQGSPPEIGALRRYIDVRRLRKGR